MIQKIKNSILVLASVLTFMAPAVVPVSAYALDCNNNSIGGNISKGSTGAATGRSYLTDCSTSTGVDNNSISKLANKVVNLFSLVVGAVSVIMIIFGGFRYITSGGASDKVGGAKNTIIYALIGLVIVALAQIIVRFVLNTTSSTV